MSQIICTDKLTTELLNVTDGTDDTVVHAARISLGRDRRPVEDDDLKLINFLMRNHHGSPFEHGLFTFYVHAPLFVFREWHRHRVGHSYNEMSGRYTELEPVFYVPVTARIQTGKPGAYTYEEAEVTSGTSRAVRVGLRGIAEQSWAIYRTLLSSGVAKEQARMVLPVNTYSKMYWTCNPRSLMHFLALRNHPSAMTEIRTLAAQVEDEFKRQMPVTHRAFNRYGRVAP